MDSNPPKRGLGALLQNTTAGVELSSTDKARLQLVPISSIRANKDQPRRFFDDGSLNELSESIRTSGIIQPVVVSQIHQSEISGEVKYELIAGERRWRASTMAGLKEIPALVKPASKATDVLLLSLIENLQRADLNPIEEAMALKRLNKSHGLTQEQIAEAISKSRAYVANSFRLVDLPEQIQQYLIDNELSVGHAKVLLSIPDQSIMLQIAAKCKANALSVRQLEMLVTGRKSIKETTRMKSLNLIEQDKKSHVHFIENRLRTHFGTKVHVEEGTKKGKIVIEFYSVEDFDRITGLMGLTDT